MVDLLHKLKDYDDEVATQNAVEINTKNLR